MVTITVDSHQIFQIVLEDVLSLDCFYRILYPLSALTLCFADTVQLLEQFRRNDLLIMYPHMIMYDKCFCCVLCLVVHLETEKFPENVKRIY